MEANKENQQSVEQAFNQALDAYKAGNFAEAAGQWLALAEDGCAPAQRALGSLYERGQGVEKNAENAFEWTKKAAEQNDPVAMFNLACYHDKGFGAEKNQQTALTWYRKAAEYGHAEAAALIASLIETGDRGLEKDMDEAVRWYQIAANRGNVLAMGRLAWLYSTGTGVPQDAAFAFQYFLKAAQGGKVGTSICEPDQFQTALDILKKAEELNVKIYLAEDAVCGKEFKNDTETKICPSNDIPDGWEGLDIGPKAIEAFSKVIAESKTILWNGPVGVFEMDNFAKGSRALAEAIVEATKKGAFSLIGGGDSVAAINKFGLAGDVSYVSTGGGALLEYMEGIELPGVAAIRK